MSAAATLSAAPVVNNYAIDQARALRARLDAAQQIEPGATDAASEAARQKATMRRTAEDFESFFLGQMFEFMSAGIKSDGPFSGGHAEQTWRSFLNQEYGKDMAKSRGVGIADMVYAQMLKLQEGAQ